MLLAVVAAFGGSVAAHGQEHAHGGAAGTTAGAAGAKVDMSFDAFVPVHAEILAGESVQWSNGSFRAHTVAADDGSWDSGRLVSGDTFGHRFDTPGIVTYHCAIHAGMVGDIGVHQLLLDTPAAGAAPGRAYPLSGRSSLEAGTDVSIEADEGAGFREIGRSVVAMDGSISATITPRQTVALRVTAGAAASPPVQLLVFNRQISAKVSRRGANAVFSTSVMPASPGATVVVQLRLPERFGWWPVRSTRLDGASRTRIVVPLRRRVPARVLLTLPDGATVLASSGTLRVPAPSPDR
jgi:plastocyanin